MVVGLRRLEGSANVLLTPQTPTGITRMSTIKQHIKTGVSNNRQSPFVELEVATAEEIRSRGAGLTLRAGIATSPYGSCLLAETARGIAYLAFFDQSGRAAALAGMVTTWPRAEILWDHGQAADLAARLFDGGGEQPWRVMVGGTPFQLAVWRALLQVPSGSLVTYGQLAAAVGHPAAARATGGAVGANPVAMLIPCHRVVPAHGAPGHYRWGAARKRQLIAREQTSC